LGAASFVALQAKTALQAPRPSGRPPNDKWLKPPAPTTDIAIADRGHQSEGKPVERRGRKATGLRVSRAA
jgi:hypothetical protein